MMPKAVSVGPLLPKSPLLTLDKINWSESGWVLEVHGPDRAPCPACLKASHSPHSCCCTLKDLPSHGSKFGQSRVAVAWLITPTGAPALASSAVKVRSRRVRI
jgi:hypothetical protein